jgi:localization factor PodJL
MAVDTLRGDLAEIRLLLDDAAPRSAIEALQREINELAERADESRGNGDAVAAVASIERRFTEVRDALCVLRPAESLLGMARVVQQASRKIEITAGAWDPAILEQLASAVAAMRSIAAQAASPAALAKLSGEVRALGAKLDDAQRRADGRILSMLEGRVAMLVDQLQARERSGPNVPVELKALIERLIDRIERIELASERSAAPACLESLVARLVEKLDACDVRLDQLATIERALAELLTHVERWHAPALAPEAAPSPAVEALARHVADLRQAEEQIEDSLEVAHGTLAHVVDRLVMIEGDLRGQPSRLADTPPPAGTVVPSMAMPTAPPASLVLAECATRPEQPTIDPDPADANVPPDRQPETGSRAAVDPNPDPSPDRSFTPEPALARARPPIIEDSGGTSTFIAAARRAAQKESRSGPTQSGHAAIDAASDDQPARRIGKTGALIGGMIIITALGALQGMGLLLPFSDETDVSAPHRSAFSTNDILPAPVLGTAAGPVPAGEHARGFAVLLPARRQLDLFRYVDGAIIATPSPGPVMPGWTLEQLLEAQMSPERWDNATSGLAPAVTAPARRKLPVAGPTLDLGPSRRTQ